MNDFESLSADTPDDGIDRYVVRYGALGYVGRFGTVHKISIARGDQVLIQTDRGAEIGEVLQTPGATGLGTPVPMTGELIGPASTQDVEQAREYQADNNRMFQQAVDVLKRNQLAVTVVDIETISGGQTILIYYLGEPNTALGPVAVKLGQWHGKATVRFVPVQSMSHDDDGSTSFAPSGSESHAPLTPRERIKSDSCLLAGTIAEELAAPSATRFSKENATLLEFHGIYQQRVQVKSVDPASGQGDRVYMIRVKVPGGRLLARQLEQMLSLADQFGDASLRVTSRQGLQLYGIAKNNLRNVMRAIDTAMLTSFGACGDVVRNIMACPAPIAHDRVRSRLQQLAGELSRTFQPASPALADIWLDDRNALPATEKLYGRTYLPHKFKIAVALPADNCVDIHAHDIGLLAVVTEDCLDGFDILVGGGLGVSHQDDDSYARLATPLGFVPLVGTETALRAIVELYRKHGNRDKRGRSRFKYLVDQWGQHQVFDFVTEHMDGLALQPCRSAGVIGTDDHLGWHVQRAGRDFLGVHLPAGRIRDSGQTRLKSLIRAICQRFRFPVRLTPQQNLLICDISAELRQEIEAMFAAYNVLLGDQVPPLDRTAMACPAKPTCRFAVADAELSLPSILSELNGQMQTLDVQTPFQLRVSGCDNGCARVYTAEVGLVGRGGDSYAVFLGGNKNGTRLNFLYRDRVPRHSIVPVLAEALQRFRRDGVGDERFGDFCHRVLRPASTQSPS